MPVSCCVCGSFDLSKSQVRKSECERRCSSCVAKNAWPPVAAQSVERGLGEVKRFKRSDNAELLSAFARRESSGIDTSRTYRVKGFTTRRRSPWGKASKSQQREGRALLADFRAACGLHLSHNARVAWLRLHLQDTLAQPLPPKADAQGCRAHSFAMAEARRDLKALDESEALIAAMPRLSNAAAGFSDARAFGFLTTLRQAELAHGEQQKIDMASTGKGAKDAGVPWGPTQVPAAPFLTPFASLHFTSGKTRRGWAVTQMDASLVHPALNGGLITSTSPPIRPPAKPKTAAPSKTTPASTPATNPATAEPPPTAAAPSSDWW